MLSSDTVPTSESAQPEPTGAERRKSPRVDLNLLVQYRTPTWDSFLRTHASNVSTTGIFIVTGEPRPVGAVVAVQFLLDDGEELFDAVGKVVRVNPIGSPNPGMGIEFLSMDDHSRELVDALVRRNMARMRDA